MSQINRRIPYKLVKKTPTFVAKNSQKTDL